MGAYYTCRADQQEHWLGQPSLQQSTQYYLLDPTGARLHHTYSDAFPWELTLRHTLSRREIVFHFEQGAMMTPSSAKHDVAAAD